jgi:SHS2 domain-containing protein
MEKYIILDHTADGKFMAFGQTLEEAYAHSALAVASLMWDWQKIEKRVTFPIDVLGSDLEQLLVRFLEEILYLLDTENFLLGAVDGVKIEKKPEGFGLQASFSGDQGAHKYEIFGSVKAITYNEMKIRKDDYVTIQVVVDM